MSSPTKPILAITNSYEDVDAIISILAVKGWGCHCVSNCQDALNYLASNPTRLVLCDSWLPGGGWKSVLDALGTMRDTPLLVVFSRHADDALWAEVLNLGGYDVLISPFSCSELQRTVASALSHSGARSAN